MTTIVLPVATFLGLLLLNTVGWLQILRVFLLVLPMLSMHAARGGQNVRCAVFRGRGFASLALHRLELAGSLLTWIRPKREAICCRYTLRMNNPSCSRRAMLTSSLLPGVSPPAAIAFLERTESALLRIILEMNRAIPNCTATIRRQVMLRVFFFFATFGEALSQTAQAFIPGQLARERSLKAAKAAALLASDAVDPADPVKDTVVMDPRRSPARAMMRWVVLGVPMFRSLFLVFKNVGAHLGCFFSGCL